jgi:CRISPR/Cas system-associated exonuclease Cas4 (RecB family)
MCVIDALVQADNYLLIIDFKTGKPSPISHQDQAQTYAIAGRAYYPDYEDIITQFWYMDTGKTVQHSYTPALISRYRPVLEARINRMLNDTQCRPKPNKYVCQWCGYKEHCEYNASN